MDHSGQLEEELCRSLLSARILDCLLYTSFAGLVDIGQCSRSEIRSTGYVKDSLEAAVWCLLTTNNFRDALVKAVNLGEDTDTIGAITGGLAGIAYGMESIPEPWMNALRKKDIIEYCLTAR